MAALPGVSHGALQYRALERAKNAALASHKGSFNKKMSLPPDALTDVLWRESNVVESFSPYLFIYFSLFYIASKYFKKNTLPKWVYNKR